MTVLSGAGNVVVSGFVMQRTPTGILFVVKYVGKENVPQDIKRMRRQVYDAMRRLGTPVLIKHRFNYIDVSNGVAESVQNFDDVYGVRAQDISHGVGLVSVANSPDEWTDGSMIVQASSSPGTGWVQAPLHRGYGPGYLVYVIEPDAALEYFKLTQAGAMYKTQTAMAQASWFPIMGDNDLLINVEIDRKGEVTNTGERYELKEVNPVSIRGYDRRGKREESNPHGPQRWLINQQFQMTRVPVEANSPLYQVETDR